MQLTKSRLHKILKCKDQTRKRSTINTNGKNTNKNSKNMNTKRQQLKPFNLRNKTIKQYY